MMWTLACSASFSLLVSVTLLCMQPFSFIRPIPLGPARRHWFGGQPLRLQRWGACRSCGVRSPGVGCSCGWHSFWTNFQRTPSILGGLDSSWLRAVTLKLCIKPRWGAPQGHFPAP